MGLPLMRAWYIIEDNATAQHEIDFESLNTIYEFKKDSGYKGIETNHQVDAAIRAHKSARKEEKPVKFITQTSSYCRESLLGSIHSFCSYYDDLLWIHNRIIDVNEDSTSHKMMARKIIVQVAVSGAQTCHLDAGRTYGAVGAGITELLYKGTPYVVVTDKMVNYPKLSMVLFFINRFEYFPEEILKDKKAIIKRIMELPPKMFPNNVSSSYAMVPFQAFAVWSNLLSTYPTHRDEYYNGVVNYAKTIAERNPLLFSQFLVEHNISTDNIGAAGYQYSRFPNIGWSDWVNIYKKTKEEQTAKAASFKW